MQSVAMPWLALQLTHSGLLVGLVLAVQFTPVLIGSQFGGVVADRYRKRNVLLATQSLFTLPSFALFIVSFLILAYLGTQPPDVWGSFGEGVPIVGGGVVGAWVARLLTILYFAFFLLMPWYTARDRERPEPLRVTH